MCIIHYSYSWLTIGNLRERPVVDTNAAAPVVHPPSAVIDVLILIAVIARSRVADEARPPLWGIK